jgi:hypothetical protein
LLLRSGAGVNRITTCVKVVGVFVRFVAASGPADRGTGRRPISWPKTPKASATLWPE